MRRTTGCALVASVLTACTLFSDLGGLSDAEDKADARGDASGASDDADGSTTLPGSDGGAGPADGSKPYSDDGSTASAASFSLTLNPAAIYVDPGEQNVTLSLQLTRTAGFVSPVTVTVNGLPSAVKVSSLTFAGAQTTGTITLGAEAGAVAGGMAITVLGLAGNESATVPASLFVTGELTGFDADGMFKVPAPAPPLLDFHLWGGGGAGGGTSGNNNSGGSGGAGGWAGGRIAVAASDDVKVVVAHGGKIGGQGGGSGGGYSSVALAGGTSDGLPPFLIAAGGGGGGAGYAETNASDGTGGGAGGGANGSNGQGPGGKGGTATAGGAADLCSLTKCSGQIPLPGASLLGGTGGRQSNGAMIAGGLPGGGASFATYAAGGGGGGGWFGGGGGGFKVLDPVYIIYHGQGGGGGSGYSAATNGPIGGESLVSGSGNTPPKMSDPRYRAGIAVGGAGAVSGTSAATAGGGGHVAIVIAKP